MRKRRGRGGAGPGRAVLVLLLAVCTAGYAGEVDGQGFAAWQRPPTADQPPGDYVADEYAHDVRTGVVFDLTDHYELRQGAHEDNKERWKDTDSIEWTVNGATLRARGRVHDGEYHEATVATSEAWGAHFVDAEVSVDEGEFGTIEAENRISFRYSYLVSGRYVGEASVQLNAVAYDLLRKDHQFHLSEQSGESVDSEENRESGTEFRVSAGGSKTMSVSNQGAEARLESHAEMEYAQTDKLDVRIARRFRQSSGASGGTPAVILHDEVSGATPVNAHYEVFSEADVSLRARAGQVPGGEESSTVLVQLDEFRVENTLRVWTSASSVPPPPGDPGDVPPTSEPEGGGGPITPGAGAGGGDTGCTDDEAEEAAPDGEADGSADDPDGCGGIRRATLPLGADQSVDAYATVVAPDGLSAEPGSRAGRARIALSAPASRELRFAIATDPDGVVTPAASELVIPQGETCGGIHVHGDAAGTADVEMRLLDGNGLATDTVLVVPVATTSVMDRAAPDLWAAAEGKARADGRGTSLRALPGSDLGMLRIGRTGFAGFFDTATTVRLDVDDPDGILEPLPGAVAIAAGTESVGVPLRLTEVAGTATITLLGDGGEQIPVRVRSAAQSWRSVPHVRVPRGARVQVPVLLAEREGGGPRAVEAASDSEACAMVEEVTEAPPGGRLAGVWVRGAALGTTTLRLHAPGLDDLAVAVEVTDPVVRLASDRLVLDGVAATDEGEIVIWMPPGVVVEAFDIPAGLEDQAEVLGVGGGKIVLSLLADPDRPAQLTFPLRLAGAPAGPFAADVLDTVHAGADSVRHTIRIDVD